jgi:hypothetical protein
VQGLEAPLFQSRLVLWDVLCGLQVDLVLVRVQVQPLVLVRVRVQPLALVQVQVRVLAQHLMQVQVQVRVLH